MAQTSVGFDGTINEQQWSTLSGYLGNGYIVNNSTALQVTAVPGTRKVSVAAGTAYGDGIATTLSVAEELSLTTPVNGQWYLIVLNRNWSTNTTSLKAVASTTTSTTPPSANDYPTSYPTIAIQPGVETDQPLAWAWCNSANTTVVIGAANNIRNVPNKDTYNSYSISPSLVRAKSSLSASLGSTEHGLQVGLTTNTHIRAGGNVIQAANTGSAVTLSLNPSGGNVSTGADLAVGGALTTDGTINAVGAAINAGTNVNAVSGAVNALTGRLTSTSDLSLSSTAHAFQIGANAGANLRMDTNEVQCVNNGAAAAIYINNDGGDVGLGNSASDTIITGRIVATNYSWAQSAGTITTSASANVNITLPTSRFTVPPIVTLTNATGGNAVCMPYIASVTNTAVAVSLYTTAGTRVAQVMHWQAVQMTSTTAAG